MKKPVPPSAPEEAPGTKEKDKKRVKKALVIAVCVFLGALLLALGAELAASLVKNRAEEDAASRRAADESGIFFFEPDYSENIYEDEVYLALDRSIRFGYMGEEILLTGESASRRGGAALLFYDYFECIINGDYAEYPGFFTEEYKKNPYSDIPERFTMQKLCDIAVKLYDRRMNDDGVIREIYEVRYAIFENNGTFRRDIPSMETRTLVFELVFDEDTPLINSIGRRGNG